MISLYLLEIYPGSSKKKGSLVEKFKKSRYGNYKYGILVWKSGLELSYLLVRKLS